MPLSSLTFSATDANTVVGSLPGPGNIQFSVSDAGAYWAHITAQAQGALDLGVYSLEIMFTPLGSPVFLPASGWLLLGGLAAVAGLQRYRARIPAQGVAAPAH